MKGLEGKNFGDGVSWGEGVYDNFEKLVGKIPVFMRGMAEAKVLKKLKGLLVDRGVKVIAEKDMVDAFFEATPFGFHGPMKMDMEEFGIDYEKYGHPK